MGLQCKSECFNFLLRAMKIHFKPGVCSFLSHMYLPVKNWIEKHDNIAIMNSIILTIVGKVNPVKV